MGLRNASHVKDITGSAAGILPAFNGGAMKDREAAKGFFVRGRFQITKRKGCDKMEAARGPSRLFMLQVCEVQQPKS